MIRGFLDAGGVRGMGVRAWKNFGNLASADEVYGICLLHYLEKKPQTTQTRAIARRDQSLSLTYVRDLLPQPLCGRIKRWAILFGNAKAAAAAARR
ncbi:hypothetical protein J6C36_04580 [Methanocorpusculaceae archaeon]|nr:hypothetical protein [Methanocorpusculaceae archaeon]MBO5431459.1 hypothetical protein [Methanocorpusculum sp.]